MKLKILSCGSMVTLEEGIEGRIKAINITGDLDNIAVMYKVAWWNGRSHQEDWFLLDEIKSNQTKKIKIGFSNDS